MGALKRVLGIGLGVALGLMQVVQANTLATSRGGFAEPLAGAPAPSVIAARGFILQDLSTRQTLASREADEPVPPGSLAKLMTAYVVSQALESRQIKLDTPVTISERAWRAALASAARPLTDVGHRLSVEDCFQAMGVLGANDAALALAELVAGSEEAFVERMNRQAQVFGLTQTVFRTADGRAASGQTSTPRELAWVADRLLTDYPSVIAHFDLSAVKIAGVEHASTNLLLKRDPSVDGLQVAQGGQLGHAMVATANRELTGLNRRLVAVVVGAASTQARAVETQKLLNWGYSAFDVIRLYAPGQAVSQAPVWKGARSSVPLGRTTGIAVAVPRGQAALIKTTLTRQDPLMAPLQEGQTVAELHISLGTQPWQVVPLQALATVPSAGWLGRTWDAIRLGIQ